MIHELILFAVCLGIGIVFRLLFKSVTILELKINSVAATILLDIVLAFIGVAAMVAASFFLNDGLIKAYMVISTIVGFVLTSLLF